MVFCRCWDYSWDFFNAFFSCIPNFLQRTHIPFIIYLLSNLTDIEGFYEPASVLGAGIQPPVTKLVLPLGSCGDSEPWGHSRFSGEPESE